MEDGAVVKLVALLAAAGPVFTAFGEADEVGDRDGRICLEELADDGALGGLEVGVGAGFL